MAATSSRGANGAGGVARVILGRVVGVHGVRGALRVRLVADDLFEVPSVMLGGEEEDPDGRVYEVARTAPGRKGEARLWLVGVTQREQAEALRGQWVSAEANELAALPEGEYYTYELVGCRVFDLDGNEIGAVQEIWPTGAHDVLVVLDEQGNQQLIPTAPEIMQAVDLEQQRISIDAIPGLIQRDETG